MVEGTQRRLTTIVAAEAVLAYLSRYTHRIAIANSRLVSCDDDADLSGSTKKAPFRPNAATAPNLSNQVWGRPCPACGGTMVIIERFEPGHAPRAPPPAKTEAA